MSFAAAFSPDYTAARARFRSSALALGCTLGEFPVGQKGPDSEDLTIDTARLGSDLAEKLVIVSSGLHGVEGFLGSAIQAALLEEELGGWKPPRNCALLLVHALNPYGFAWVRRVNEDNADLNRNFLLRGEKFEGSPELYPMMDGFFNPQRPPLAIEPFRLRAAWTILRHGMRALKDTLPVGQYEYPKGLFYGGSGPSQTNKLLRQHLPQWVGPANHVVHIDFHSGQGRWNTHTLVANHASDHPRVEWLSKAFAPDPVEAWDPGDTLYTIRGGLGAWCAEAFPNTHYDQITAEFGTYNTIAVVDALRDENMAHHHSEPGSKGYERAKRRLKETFAPADSAWRDSAVRRGLKVVERAIEGCFG